MIKATGTYKGGRKVLVIGLSFANLAKLQADALDGFIRIAGEEIDYPGDVLITAGRTEAEMHDFLRDLIGPDTKVHIDERLKS